MANASLIGFQVVSTLLLDANATLLCTTASEFLLATSTLTANRTVTISATGAVVGEAIRIIRLDKTAYTLTVVNGGTGGGTLITLAAGLARVADFSFNGTDYSLSGVVRLL